MLYVIYRREIKLEGGILKASCAMVFGIALTLAGVPFLALTLHYRNKAYKEVREMPIYEEAYEGDTKEIVETLENAKKEYADVEDKFENGEISEYTFRKAELEYKMAQKEYDKAIKEYNTSTYLEYVIRNYCPEDSPCVKNLEKFDTLKWFALFSPLTVASGIGIAYVAYDVISPRPDNDDYAHYDRKL